MDNLESHTPQQIALAIFSKDPTPEFSNSILIDQDDADATFIFEILLTILLEALDIFTQGVNEADMSNFSQINITSLNPWFKSLGFVIKVDDKPVPEVIYNNKIVSDSSSDSSDSNGDSGDSGDSNGDDSDDNNSIVDSGDDGDVDDSVDVDDDTYTWHKYYCKVLLNKGHNEMMFYINSVTKSRYQFLLNGVYLEMNRNKQLLKDLYAVFEANNTIYKISFENYTPVAGPNTKLL